jgi:predicted cytidylate kinase
MKIQVITITGEVATGKSTIAEALLKKLDGWKKANTGQKFREICASRGWSIQKVSFLPDEVHKEVDEWQKMVAETESRIIIEGRLAGWLTRDLPHVFQVFCWTPLDVRVQRYMDREHTTAEIARSEIEFRDQQDVLKYQRAYGLDDYRDRAFYDIFIDTSKYTPEEIADLIIQKAKLKNELRTEA